MTTDVNSPTSTIRCLGYRPMVLALDYDGTYTRDPDFFDAVVSLALSRGHRVVCISNRAWSPDPGERVPSGVPFIPAGVDYKRDAARAGGYSVDVWIDDVPGTIEPPVSLP